MLRKKIVWKNSLLVSLALYIALFSVTIAVVAQYWVYTQEVLTVNVSNYVVTLTETHDGLLITFSGQLTYKGAGVPGKTVYIYTSNLSKAEFDVVCTATTDSSGNFQIVHKVLSEGTYHFMAKVEVP